MPPRDPNPAPTTFASMGREVGGAFKLFDRLLCGDRAPTLEELEAEARAASPADDPNTITVQAEASAVVACPTCAGAGAVGVPGHQVQCPACGGGGIQR